MKLIVWMIGVCMCVHTMAQELIPVRRNHAQQKLSVASGLPVKSAAAEDTLTLPFIDDFAISHLIPDTVKFLHQGGVYINNHYPVQPPTMNVATFDGLDAFGAPYNQSNPFARGLCDTLTSRPFNLAATNDVWMSFWWQAQGNAVPQVSTDSLRLMFKDTSGAWERVWVQTGTDLDAFSLEMINVTDEYLYAGFQFRFESYGNQSGMFGVWHVDYIYLNDDRSATDTVLNDIAFSTTPSSFLRKYWAMPLWQFLEDPAGEVNDSVYTTLNNFKDDGSGLSYVMETFGNVRDTLSDNVQTIHTDLTNLIAPYERNKKVAGTNLSTTLVPLASGYTAVRSEFTVTSNDQAIGDTVSGVVAEFNTNHNDSICSFATLADYYAYDDGTAEQAFRITQQEGVVVQKFELNRPDTLYGVSVYFPDNVYDYDSTEIVWMVWKNASGDYNLDDIIYDERALIKVADSLNGFAYYNFFDPVPLVDVFYLGYKQDDTYNILIGYDVNSDPGFEPIYFNTTGSWQRFQQVKGVLMIRPLFRPHLFTALPSRVEELQITAFPNPMSHTLYLSQPVDRVEVFDMAGKHLLSAHGRIQQLDISALTQGMYVVSLFDGGKSVTKKMIKQ